MRTVLPSRRGPIPPGLGAGCGQAKDASAGPSGLFSGVLTLPSWAMFACDMTITNHLGAHRPALRPVQCGLLATSLLLLVALVAGCAHSPREAERGGAYDALPAPLPPGFLNGPMALLLTNQDGFRAHAVLESGLPPQPGQTVSGELIGRGGKLLFAPAPAGNGKKKARPEDSAFIWDVAGNRGWVLNDPLQGYAPVSTSRQYTNVTASAPSGGTPEKIAGHPCQQGEVTVTAADGITTVFRVWQATDLKGFPLRIVCPSNGVPMTLTLSKVRLEAVPNDLFAPPNGFTKYESSEAMMAELFLRKHNLSRKQVYQPVETDPAAGTNERAPTRRD
jgi:hypothetical protein